MWNLLLDLLFPRRSLSGSEGTWITDDERKHIRLTPALLTTTELRKRGLKNIDLVVAAGSYEQSPLLRKAILTFKFKRIQSLGEDIALWMTNATNGLLIPPEDMRKEAPLLCPVPLHWSRKYQRGFNQADVLAEIIGKKMFLETQELLKRTRSTGQQSRRNREERLKALEHAFACQRTPPSYVILIDDLCTTGATLDACAKELKSAGALYVSALVAAVA